MIYKRKVRKTRKRFFSLDQAQSYIGDLEKGTEIFGITKGQFSIIDIIEHVLNFTGKANVLISTWTAAHADIKKASSFLQNNKIDNIRFMVDRGFINRQPEYCADLKRLFGEDSIRFFRLHAKFVVIYNDDYHFVIRTSMNLNENKRFENFEITEDKDFCNYFIDFFNICFDNKDINDGKGDITNIPAFDDSDDSFLDLDLDFDFDLDL